MFLESVIHSYLYIHGLYPTEAFVSRNLFGLNIKSAGENSLKSYIHDFIQSLEDINNKGILHAVTILVTENNEVIQDFTVKINWIMNIYGLNDSDKVLSTASLDSAFSAVLVELYSQPERVHKDRSFRFVVETIKEEAAEEEEVFNREHWQIVSTQNRNPVRQAIVDGVLNVEWG